MNLNQKYQPRCWADIAGQDEAVKQIQRLAERGLDGRVLWITGKSGTGKGSLAMVACHAAVGHSCAITTMNATDLSIDRCREIEKECRMSPVWGGCHAYCINECHRLRGLVLSYLNDLLELPHVMRTSFWAFTTTLDGEKKLFDEDEIESVPFGSRTIPIRLKYDESVTLAFALRAREIAQAEHLDGQPLDKYVACVRKHHHNLREVLNAIDAGEMLSC